MRDLNVADVILCLTVNLEQEQMFKLGNQSFILLSLKAIQH